MLVYIDDKKLLSLIVSYLDLKNVLYTVNYNDFFDTIIVAQYNKRTINMCKKSKKVIFITYLLEYDLFFNFDKFNDVVSFIKNCDKVIVGFSYFKKLLDLKKCYVVPYLNFNYMKCKKSFFKKNYKYITFVDLSYRYISLIDEVVSSNLDFNYNIVGYNVMNKSAKKIYESFGKNVVFTKYFDDVIFLNVLNNSSLIIFFDNILDNYFLFNLCVLNKKNILLYNSELYSDLFCNNKNIYLFDSNNLVKIFNKVVSNRVSNLGEELFNVFFNNNIEVLSDKFCKVIK